MSETTFIYALNDPETGCIRYVGKSDNPFKRYCDHLREPHTKKTPKRCWIESLRRKALVPCLELLDEVPHEEWEFWEREYIRLFRAIGMPLLNHTEGGEGQSKGYSPSEDARKKASQSQKGRKYTAAQRENMKRAQQLSRHNLGRKWSRETCEKMSRSHLGKKMSEETIKKIVAAKTGSVASAETRAKLSAYRKGMKHSENTKRKLSLLGRGKTLTEDHKRKIGESLKGRPMPMERRQKLSLAIRAKRTMGQYEFKFTHENSPSYHS